jgi:hypothetical protein
MTQTLNFQDMHNLICDFSSDLHKRISSDCYYVSEHRIDEFLVERTLRNRVIPDNLVNFIDWNKYTRNLKQDIDTITFADEKFYIFHRKDK